MLPGIRKSKMQTKVITPSISHPRVGGCDLYHTLCVTGAVTPLLQPLCAAL